MQIFDGLYLYEIVLLVLGCVLFVVIVFAFLYQILHGKKVSALVLFLLVAIVMIAYPSVQEIQYKDGMVTITKYTQQIQQNPADSQTRVALQQAVTNVAPRLSSFTSSADNVAAVASAQYALGDEPAAAANLHTALSLNPRTPRAVALQQRIDTVDRLTALTATVQAQPANNAAATELQNSVRTASLLHLANPHAIFKLAQAQAALGQKQQAATTTERVLTISPNLTEALHLQQQLHATAPANR